MRDSCLVDECGIVAQIATPLADQEISTFYISTYDRDHVLVSCMYITVTCSVLMLLYIYKQVADLSLTKALKVLNEFQKDNS